MKGFKPTGYGPSAGFKYPASMGFTGSTGSVTNVSPHVRRIGFAKGGYVRKEVGDPGSAMVRRAKPSTEADREYGGNSPLAPGFQSGGMTSRTFGRMMEKAKAQGATPAPRQYTGGGALGRALSMVASKPAKSPQPMSQATMAAVGRALGRAQNDKRMRVPTPVKGRFYDKGGKVSRRPKELQYTFTESVKAIPEAVKALGEYATDSIKGKMYKRSRTVGGRNESVGEAATRIERGNYSHGGKAKRMGYAEGGGVSRGEAKKIAQKTVGEHVRYPAPKGHKGQRVCK